jgi:hypothetical protein
MPGGRVMNQGILLMKFLSALQLNSGGKKYYGPLFLFKMRKLHSKDGDAAIHVGVKEPIDINKIIE